MIMDKQELLRKYLDEELTPAEEREVLHLIADDEELRSALRFDLFLRQTFSSHEFSKETFEVPEYFSGKVMSEIEQKERMNATESLQSQLKDKITRWIETLFTPRSFQLKPAFAFAIFALILLTPVLPYYFLQNESGEISQNGNEFETQTVADTEEMVWVRFIYVDDNAESIAIAGDFNSWAPDSLTKQQVNGQNVWTGFFSMPRGEHKYMFVVNGEKWVTDPLANMYQDDGFGNKNAIIYL